MNDAAKFTFDEDFDDSPERLAARRAKEASRYSEEELEAARQAAMAEGKAAGVAEARQQIEETIGRALEGIAGSLSDFTALHNTAQAAQRAEAVSLAHLIATKLAPSLMARQPLAEIEALVSECLSELLDEPRIVVRSAEALIGGLTERLDGIAQRAGFPGQIVLLPDDALVGDACRVEWADGGAERDPVQIAKSIEAAVQRYQTSTTAAASDAQTNEAEPAPDAEPPVT
ncbi:MAG: hypothetical protein MI806_30460 [Minwuiales bacterium]|nr:hypothetical protein [Minwuiales bacterium]